MRLMGTDDGSKALASLLRGNAPEPVYVNFAEIGHNAIEIRIKFSFVGPDHEKLIGEVVMAPIIAKTMLTLLDEQVKSYEEAMAPIYMPNDKRGLEGLFGGRVEKSDGDV
mgnify:FL=1